ncbi:PIG-L deacetylase family protein [Imhoffiella purpurea]|nr:PIG-L deacetylase family protein [Imhoffiella purpurea]
MKTSEHPFSESRFVPYRAVRTVGRGPVLVLAPHPDDEVFGCGGAIMRHLEAGDPVRVVIATDGALGVGPDQPDPIRTRQNETRRAADLLGHQDPQFWSWPDRGLEYGETLIDQILEAIADWAAELVYAPSWWEIHPDHLTLALASAEAVRRCSRPLQLAFYEVGSPLWPNRLLDITDLAERKRAAMACFASQMAQQDYDRHVAALNSFRTYTLSSEVRAVEAFRLLNGEELRTPPWDAMRPSPETTLAALAESLRLPRPSERSAEDEETAARIRALTEEIEALERSTSWRLTAPLRWLVTRLRGIGRRS